MQRAIPNDRVEINFFLIITQNGVIKKCSESSQKEVKSLKNRKKLPFIARWTNLKFKDPVK